MAREACAIVSQLRHEELQTIWSAEADKEIFPGMMFSMAKEQMEKTKLFEIVRQMPKGALLHCHLEATLDMEWLVREALATEGMHVAAPTSLHTSVKRTNAAIEFDWTRKRSKPAQSLWRESYEPHALVPVQQAAETFPEGGEEGFIKWLVSKMTITSEESVEHHTGVHTVWVGSVADLTGGNMD